MKVMRRRTCCTLLMIAVLAITNSCNTTPQEKTAPDVVFVATPHRVVREMLKLADVRKDDMLYDLGSGDGRIVIAAARDFGARAVGVEIDRKLVNESMENAKRAGVAGKVEFVTQDMFKTDLRGATVVTLFLLPDLNKTLMPKLFKELEPGSRVVSHMWDMDDWKPDMTLKAYGSTVHFWIIPGDVDGDWQVSLLREEGTGEYAMALSQKHQKVRGTIRDGSRKMKLRDVGLYGREISLKVEDRGINRWFLMELDGTVRGDTMEGTANVTEGKVTGTYRWKAVRVKKGQ
jgi:precorrin-6B methylase 2